MQKDITKEQAQKIAEFSSSIYQQGNSWVLKELDIDTGVYKLTRNLTEKSAKQKLKLWRREKIEQLLRAYPNNKAYALRTWYENPNWKGEGVWRWSEKHRWYVTKDEAEEALLKQRSKDKVKNKPSKYQIFELKTSEIPGHFFVA